MKIKLMSILLLIIMFAIPSFAADKIDFPFGAGKKGNTYDRVIGGNLAAQLGGSRVLNFSVKNYNGSDDIIAALHSGEIVAGVVQLDSLIGNDQGIQLVSKTHDEFAHLIVAAKGDVDEVGDLIGKKIAVGKLGGGSAITWRNWCALDEKYGKKVGTIPKDGALALSDIENGKIAGLLYIGGLKGKDMMRANQRKDVYKLAKINDSQFNNLEVKGEKVYTFDKIDDDVYPNLIDGWSVKTLKVPAWIVISEAWLSEHEDAYDAFYDAVTAALPNIAQALVND